MQLTVRVTPCRGGNYKDERPQGRCNGKYHGHVPGRVGFLFAYVAVAMLSTSSAGTVAVMSSEFHAQETWGLFDASSVRETGANPFFSETDQESEKNLESQKYTPLISQSIGVSTSTAFGELTQTHLAQSDRPAGTTNYGVGDGLPSRPAAAETSGRDEGVTAANAESASALSVDRDGARNVSVAFVNIGRIIDDSPQSEAAMRELEREFGPRDAELVAEREALARLRERAERSFSDLSVDAAADLERELTTRSRELRRAQESFTEDLNLRRNEELARLQRRVNEAIVRLARERGIDLVVTERNVLYTSERIDLTDEVIRAMDQ